MSISFTYKLGSGLTLAAMIIASPPCSAQDRDRERGRDWDQTRGIYTRLEPGTIIPVRTNETRLLAHPPDGGLLAHVP